RRSLNSISIWCCLVSSQSAAPVALPSFPTPTLFRSERVAVGIGKRLAELDPPGHAVYLERTKQFVAGLRGARARWEEQLASLRGDRKSTRLNSSHVKISYAVFFLKKKKNTTTDGSSK